VELGEISGSHGGEYEDVFWDVAPCSLVDVYRRFSGTSIITLMMEAASTCETSVTSTRLHGATFHKTVIFGKT
jgi:hypothetical protein